MEDVTSICELDSYNDYVQGSGVHNVNIIIGYNFSSAILSKTNARPDRWTSRTVSLAIKEAQYNTIKANGGEAYSRAFLRPGHVETYTIPAHYEEVAELPYAVCDTYERIEQTPWFILSTHSSLTSALEKARAVVKSVGIDNVKVIKVVPTEQFVKIN